MKKLSTHPRWRFESQLLWWVDPGVASTHLAVIREPGNGSEHTSVTLPTQWPRNRRQTPHLFLSAEIKWVSLAAAVTHVNHAEHYRGRRFWRNCSGFYVICGSSAPQLRCSRWPNALLRLSLACGLDCRGPRVDRLYLWVSFLVGFRESCVA